MAAESAEIPLGPTTDRRSCSETSLERCTKEVGRNKILIDKVSGNESRVALRTPNRGALTKEDKQKCHRNYSGIDKNDG